MGSGKSWWGSRLAERLNRPFVDLDNQIEAGEGKTIAQIFEEHGEARFRKMERDYLQRLASAPVSVVATGGGTPCFFDNLTWMNAQGLTIYLKTPVDVLLARLRLDRSARPLLQGVAEHDLELKISHLLELREPWYRQAQVTLEQGGKEAAFLAALENVCKGKI